MTDTPASSAETSVQPSESSSPAQAQNVPLRIANVVTVYADGFLNVWPDYGVVKMFLYRREPVPGSNNPVVVQNNIVGQLVMPYKSLIQTAFFFEYVLKDLVRTEVLTQEQVDAERAALIPPKS